MAFFWIILLVGLSALFSGLTLGLLSLDLYSLKRQALLGNEEAKVIYPIRLKGNLLLTTLLLGNVAVNTTLSLYMGTLINGFIAGILATGLIFVLGEIVPQAVISRYAMWFGARTVYLVQAVMWLLYPFTFLIAWGLDKLLGKELPKFYSKSELMSIISEHEDAVESAIDEDEERILHGALMFSHAKVGDVMTGIEEVVMFEEHEVLSEEFKGRLAEIGHSRYPVYRDRRSNVVGVLYAKNLLAEETGIKIREANEALETNYLIVTPGRLLDGLLSKMLKSKKHLAVVVRSSGECIGVITLEDIIEEIIQQEIEDESDE